MARFRLRKMTVILDEIHHDGGPDAARPRQRGAVLAVVSNPFAGRYEADLQSAMEDLKPLGKAMAEKLIAALGGAEGIDAYGKGSIVGEAGELEHGALWHAPGGYGMREILGNPKAIDGTKATPGLMALLEKKINKQDPVSQGFRVQIAL